MQARAFRTEAARKFRFFICILANYYSKSDIISYLNWMMYSFVYKYKSKFWRVRAQICDVMSHCFILSFNLSPGSELGQQELPNYSGSREQQSVFYCRVWNGILKVLWHWHSFLEHKGPKRDRWNYVCSEWIRVIKLKDSDYHMNCEVAKYHRY